MWVEHVKVCGFVVQNQYRYWFACEGYLINKQTTICIPIDVVSMSTAARYHNRLAANQTMHLTVAVLGEH